jgi:excisionase family DNA binding protein
MDECNRKGGAMITLTDAEKKEKAVLRQKAAKFVREALPEAMATVFDEMLLLNMLGGASVTGNLTDSGYEYLQHVVRKVKKALENAASFQAGKTQDIADLLTVDEAAKLTKVSTATIYRMVQSGELRGVRFGRLVRIAQEDLAILIDHKRLENP